MKRVQKSDSFEAFKFFRNQNYPDIKKNKQPSLQCSDVLVIPKY